MITLNPVLSTTQVTTQAATQLRMIYNASLPPLSECYSVPVASLTPVLYDAYITGVKDNINVLRRAIDYSAMTFNLIDVLTIIGYTAPRQAMHRLVTTKQYDLMPLIRNNSYIVLLVRVINYPDLLSLVCRLTNDQIRTNGINLVSWLWDSLPVIMSNADIHSMDITPDIAIAANASMRRATHDAAALAAAKQHTYA